MPRKPRLVGGVKGHNINEITYPGSPALWAGSFTLLEQKGIILPELIKQGVKLTRFAVFTRYPGIASPVNHEEYEEALILAKEIVDWVKGQIES